MNYRESIEERNKKIWRGKYKNLKGIRVEKKRENESRKEENVCMNEERRLNKWRFYGCKHNKNKKASAKGEKYLRWKWIDEKKNEN